MTATVQPIELVRVPHEFALGQPFPGVIQVRKVIYWK
jgi:hypothetical protein